MVATTGYSAGVETNATTIAYGIEAAWTVVPAVAFQNIRYTGETLSYTKTRQRPAEITGTREATQPVTTQQAAGGSINYALSYSTFDDFFSVVMGNDWQAVQAIAGISGDVTITNTAGVTTLSSSLSSKFTNITALTWIKLYGFTNAGNNGWWFVSVKTSNQLMTLTGPNTSVTETPTGTNAQIRASTLKNGTLFKSMYIQQTLASGSMYLTYPGSYVSRMTIQGGIGNFFSGTIDIVSASEAKATSSQSTGAHTAAPTGRVFDPVNGWVAFLFNEAAFSVACDQFSLTLENTGAAPEYAMGNAGAAGMLGGTFTCSGTARCYFKDFTQYDLFQNETSGRLSIIIKDYAGASYAFTILNCVLIATLETGGPGQPVYANYTLESGPASTGGTLVIDRLAAS